MTNDTNWSATDILRELATQLGCEPSEILETVQRLQWAADRSVRTPPHFLDKSDLVARLRRAASNYSYTDSFACALLSEAADMIGLTAPARQQ